MRRITPILWLACASLLVAAVFRLPYGYYDFLRIVICGSAAMIVVAGLFEETTRSDTAWMVIFALIGVLFNPVLPIKLHRTTWFYLDLTTAGIFVGHLLFCRTFRRQHG
jgi:ABC-type Fe3+-siderophore transport system permease subunit